MKFLRSYCCIPFQIYLKQQVLFSFVLLLHFCGMQLSNLLKQCYNEICYNSLTENILIAIIIPFYRKHSREPTIDKQVQHLRYFLCLFSIFQILQKQGIPNKFITEVPQYQLMGTPFLWVINLWITRFRVIKKSGFRSLDYS